MKRAYKGKDCQRKCFKTTELEDPVTFEDPAIEVPISTEMARRNYLEVEPRQNVLFNLVEDPDMKEFDLDGLPPEFTGITPKPGFCVKAKTDNNEKLFINVCHCREVPAPPPSTDLLKIVAGGGTDEEALFRFPLSLGELHVELDKKGGECKCYDVVINSEYYEEVSKNSVLRDVITTLACSGLERKYNISIDVGTCIILNKPYHGKMPLHYIRLQSSTESELTHADKITADQEDIVMPVKDVSCLKVMPISEIKHYDLFRVPSEGNASLIVFQGLTTGITDKKSVNVLVSKRKLTVRDAKYKILVTVALPYDVIPEKSLSNFWKNRLFVAMPVLSADM